MVTAVTPQSSTVNRQYKSSIFAMLFSDRRELLKLYNAVNGTSYTDLELLTVNTLENAIYMAVKNDVSFLIGTRLYLYEHQSTWNPNLPLRNLFYVSDLYSAITEERNLYSSKRIQIPTPHFLVFYNGEEHHPGNSSAFHCPARCHAAFAAGSRGLRAPGCGKRSLCACFRGSEAGRLNCYAPGPGGDETVGMI